MRKRVVLSLMCLVFASISPAASYAAGESTGMEVGINADAPVIRPRYTNIIAVSGDVSTAGSEVQAWVMVTTRKDATIKIKMQLQKKKDGIWSTVKTWNKSFYSKSSVSVKEKYGAGKGTYRMKYTVTVGEDSQKGTTSEVKI